MINKEIRAKKISSIKKELIKQYVYIMSSILGFYGIVFLLYIKDNTLSYYCNSASILLLLIWLILRNRAKAETLISGYLFIAPLFCTFVTLRLWETTVISLVWLIPIPFGAYIFFKNKIIIYECPLLLILL